MPRPEKVEKLPRHSGTGTRGLAKKDGHAGKYGWGKPGTGHEVDPNIDKEDPNYESEEEGDVLIQKLDVPSPIEGIVSEFLASGDIPETAHNIAELQPSELPRFVKKSLFITMEKCAYERELVSLLLSSSEVYSKVITSGQIQEGFQLALDSIEDASLDIPDATDTLAKFLGRAIVDEIVPPKFLNTAKASCPKALEALRIANNLYTDTHGSVRLAHIWGPGDLRSVKKLKKEVSLILEEYLTTGDIEEAEKCVRKLNVPSFFFQVIRQALRLAMQNAESNQKKILHLLADWSKSGLIVPDQMDMGFNLTYANLNDIKLDIPHANILLAEITAIAKKEGWLNKLFVPPSPKPLSIPFTPSTVAAIGTTEKPDV